MTRQRSGGKGTRKRKTFKNKKSQHGKEFYLKKKSKNSQNGSSRNETDNIHPEQIKEARLVTEQVINRWKQAATQLRKKPTPENPVMDPWQAEALEALLNGENVVVDAPTTAGKTRIVEEFFKINVSSNRFRSAYTTPVKSLSNDKLREFSEDFGSSNVGIATGDIKENLNAPIVVATLESYRNSLLGVEPDLGRSLVIFDEYHFMQDSGRGSAWEEAIILTPPNCQILLLSASVENAEDFCAWIESIKKRTCRLIQTTVRPVPLENLVYYKEQWLLGEEVEKLTPPTQNKGSRFPIEQKEVARRLSSVLKLELTPTIVYSGQRLSCETMAHEICKAVDPLPKVESLKIKNILENECEIDNPTQFMKSNLRRMLIMYGVGYHHSGIAPQGRRAVEILVKQGALRFCVATMGLSIGINFSVRSTLISDYRRPGEAGFTDYGPSEVLQMLGRAGRRGRDAVGFSLWPSLQAFKKFSHSKREDCESRLKNDPTTFLGLLGRGFSLGKIESFYKKSYLNFGSRGVSFALIREETIKKYLETATIPCSSPAHEISLLRNDQSHKCGTCNFQKKCHSHIESHFKGSLAALHIHLHDIECIDDHDKLSDLGSLAKYFPQGGGLLIATLIDQGNFQEDNLTSMAELMASLSLARFKEPEGVEKYKYPFDKKKTEAWLEELYPLELFEELYDPPNSRRDSYVIREFNPSAGAIVRDWIQGASWIELKKRFCHEKFAEGDLVAILYRTSTYLQSLVQAKIPQLSEMAKELRETILREPLTPPRPTIEMEAEANQKETPGGH